MRLSIIIIFSLNVLSSLRFKFSLNPNTPLIIFFIIAVSRVRISSTNCSVVGRFALSYVVRIVKPVNLINELRSLGTE